ncbi:MAG TPA: sugar-binding protein [Armatimonadota bacterium]|jgi:hypothetical protein
MFVKSVRLWVVGATLVGLLSASGAGANLAPNPGFEEGAEGTCAAWQVTEAGVPGEGGAVASWTTEQAHSGKRSLKLQMTGDGMGYVLVGSPPLPVVGGYEYELSFWYRSSGLRPENAERTQYSAMMADNFLCSAAPAKYLANRRLPLYQDSPEWQRVSLTYRVTEPGAATVQLRLALGARMPGLKPVVYLDDVSLEPLDASLPNGGFEAGAEGPDGWRHSDTGNPAWTRDQAHGGQRSVSLSESPLGQPSAWYTDLPCRPDRKYGLSGWIKTAKLNPNALPPGAVVALTFLDAQGAAVGAPAVSGPVAGDSAWTRVQVEPQVAPPGAVLLRASVQMVFCGGTAWFDDLDLSLAPTEAATVRRVARTVTGPEPGVTYAPNLVPNPTLEEGADGKPVGWTFVGKSDPDWTPQELDTYYNGNGGRPLPSMGRARGEWSDEAFAGKHSLLLIPVEPPLSKVNRWYGEQEVDAYWQSDAMPCAPGQQYFAAAWLKVTNDFRGTWNGPLRVFFYDAQGNRLNTALPRTAFEPWSPGQWAWYCTAPLTAPAGAATMRLILNQGLRANAGTFGRMWADNLAVWARPELGRDLPAPATYTAESFRHFLFDTHRQVRPPYLPAPDFVPTGDTTCVKVSTSALGNLFFDPKQPTPLTVTVGNFLAEKRSVVVRLTKYSWQGARTELPPVPVSLNAWSETAAPVALPAAGKYDCYYVEATVREAGAPTGSGFGRLAVLPRPTRPHYPAAESHWQVSVGLQPGDMQAGAPGAERLAAALKLVGFGSARLQLFPPGPTATSAQVEATVDALRPTLAYFKSLGLDVVLNIQQPGKEIAAQIGRLLGSDVAVWDVGGVEQANLVSPGICAYGSMKVEDYDRAVSETVDGLRSALPQAKIMGGAIATDMEAKVLQRWYQAGIAQKFDGFTYNTYMGWPLVLKNNFAVMDKHGDSRKPAWIEEIPVSYGIYGANRLISEQTASRDLVRTFVSLLSDFSPRFQRITAWEDHATIKILSGDAFPRPMYPALVVLTDKFGRATFDQSLGNDRLSIYRWREGPRTLGILWATVGEQSVTLETTAKSVTVTDLMGNAERRPVSGGLVTLNLTEAPLYLEDAGEFTVSRRLQVSVTHAASAPGAPPVVRVTLKNNGAQRLAGQLALSGVTPLDPASTPFDLAPGRELILTAKVLGEAPVNSRGTYRAVATTKEGYVFAGLANLNFATAAHAATPPALDGTWQGWEAAPVLRLDSREQLHESLNPGESWTGPADSSAKLRLLWDDRYLYLGVEATDDVLRLAPETLGNGFSGFCGDSLEFAVQPDNLLQSDAPRQEFELYRPAGQTRARLNARFNAQGKVEMRQITSWTCSVVPTGHNADLNYQVAIPWAELGGPAPSAGRAVSFALVLNDTDLDHFTGGRGWLSWFEGVATGKSPALYGDVVLGQ